MTITHWVLLGQVTKQSDLVIHGVALTSSLGGTGEVGIGETSLAQPLTQPPTNPHLIPPAPLPTTPQPNFIPPMSLPSLPTAEYANAQFQGKLRSRGAQPKVRNLQRDRSALGRLREEERSTEGQQSEIGPPDEATSGHAEQDIKVVHPAHSSEPEPDQYKHPYTRSRGPDGRFTKSKQ